MWNAVSRNGRSISARCSATATIRCRSCWIGGCGNTTYRPCSAGRCRILALTAQGKQFYDRFIAIVHEVNDRLEKGFSPEEIRLLTSLLLRVAKNLSEEDEVC